MKLPAILGILVALHIQSASKGAPTVDETASRIVASGRQTLTRFQSEALSWTTTIELQGGAIEAIVEHVQEPERRSIRVSFANQHQTQNMVHIIEREGFWFVTEPDQSYKCRPYEAPLYLPSLYHLMCLSELRVIDDVESLATLGKFESIENDVAILRVPLSPGKLTQLRAALPLFRQAMLSPDAEVEVIQKQMAIVEELIERGTQLTINLDYGYMEKSGGPGQLQYVNKFKWIPTGNATHFEVSGHDYEDRQSLLSNDLEARSNLAMFSHCRAWQAGTKPPDTGTVLLNLDTGHVSRVPFQKGICTPGCFSADRTKVFVSGFPAGEGGGGLYEIDLETGNNRQLAVGEIQGIPMFPTLSPDGKTLATLEVAPGMNVDAENSRASLLYSQIFIVDVTTGNATRLGKPLDTAFLSWLPDMSGLLMIKRNYEKMNTTSIDTLARIDLDGSISKLRKGTRPQLVMKGSRILYQDQDTNRWFTCDLSGGDPNLLGKGLSGFGFPGPSPDGEQVLMMKFDQATGPKPYKIDIHTGEATPIRVGNGLWTMPAWR